MTSWQIRISHISQWRQVSNELWLFDELVFNVLCFVSFIDDDRVQTLSHFGYPIDYVKYTIMENEANYCVTAYYLLGTDQNY